MDQTSPVNIAPQQATPAQEPLMPQSAETTPSAMPGKDHTLRLLAFIFAIIGIIPAGLFFMCLITAIVSFITGNTGSGATDTFYSANIILLLISPLLPLVWTIPMTVHTHKIYKGKAKNTVVFGVLNLIFLNLISGILLLCSKKDQSPMDRQMDSQPQLAQPTTSQTTTSSNPNKDHTLRLVAFIFAIISTVSCGISALVVVPVCGSVVNDASMTNNTNTSSVYRYGDSNSTAGIRAVNDYVASNETNPTVSDSEISAALILMTILILIPLAWMIPMTIHMYGIYKGKKKNTIAFGICSLIFCNLVSGILLLCSQKDQ